MNTTLVAAVVLLWVVVVALCLVVFGLTRQIGVLLERVAPAGAMLTPQHIQPGEVAPRLTLEGLDAARIEVGEERADGRSQLIFFLSTTCPMCDALLPVVRSIADGERAWLDVLLATDGPEEDHAGFIRRKKLEGLPYVVSRELGEGMRVAQLPFAALVDGQGVVRSAGLVNTREHLESLLEAARLGVASIQEVLEG